MLRFGLVDIVGKEVSRAGVQVEWWEDVLRNPCSALHAQTWLFGSWRD